MEELIKVGMSTTMSSREIAEITGKEHKNVMRDIRELEEQVGAELKFELSEYKDSTGRALPMYALTQEQTILLVSGYDAVLRLKIIRRWAELESKQKPLSTIDMIIQSALQMKALEERMDAIESRPQINAPVEHFSILGYCRNVGKQISIEEARVYGVKCRRMCNELGLMIGKVLDPRFGSVNTYPLDVLKQIMG